MRDGAWGRACVGSGLMLLQPAEAKCAFMQQPCMRGPATLPPSLRPLGARTDGSSSLKIWMTSGAGRGTNICRNLRSIATLFLVAGRFSDRRCMKSTTFSNGTSPQHAKRLAPPAAAIAAAAQAAAGWLAMAGWLVMLCRVLRCCCCACCGLAHRGAATRRCCTATVRQQAAAPSAGGRGRPPLGAGLAGWAGRAAARVRAGNSGVASGLHCGVGNPRERSSEFAECSCSA